LKIFPRGGRTIVAKVAVASLVPHKLRNIIEAAPELQAKNQTSRAREDPEFQFS
jgi:hypothetical protein